MSAKCHKQTSRRVDDFLKIEMAAAHRKLRQNLDLGEC
jgi:hypothetical protein